MRSSILRRFRCHRWRQWTVDHSRRLYCDTNGDLSYLDNRRALDTFHALPVTRGKQFLGTITAGLFLLFVPFVVAILPVMAVVDIMQACAYTMNRGNELVWANISSTFTGEYLQVTLTVAVTALMFYMLMSFLMFCCSTILESAGYFAIVMLGYVALVSMGMNQIGNATFGFTRNGFWLTDVLLRFSPLYYFISSSSGRRLNVWPYVLQIMLLAIVFGLLAWRRAVSRKSEQAGGYIWSPVYYIVAMGRLTGSGACSLPYAGRFGVQYLPCLLVQYWVSWPISSWILSATAVLKNIVRSLVPV